VEAVGLDLDLGLACSSQTWACLFQVDLESNTRWNKQAIFTTF